MQADSRYDMNRLVELTGVPARTIRFYIQMELVPGAHGARRGAWYDDEHVQRLLKVKALTEKGLSLEAVRRALSPDDAEQDEPAAPGVISTRSVITIAPGLEVHVDPKKVVLDGPGMRRFALAIMQAYEKELEDKKES